MAITSSPMSVNAGREYDQWITRLANGLEELIAEGTAPPFQGLDQFLKLSDRLRAAVKGGAEQAARTGQATFTINVEFSEAEQRTLSEMGASLLSYLEILSLRGKIDPTMSPGVQEAIAAMTPLL